MSCRRYPSAQSWALLLIFSHAAIAQPQCGDCNLAWDGVTILDAHSAARIVVNLLPPSASHGVACDVDGSGGIDVRDALVIAQYSVGYPVTLGCAGAAGSAPVIIAYVESLRFGYTGQIPMLDTSLVDIVIHGFVTPDLAGGLTENGNFTDFRTWPWATPPQQPLPDAVHAGGAKIVMSVGGATVQGSTFATICADPNVRQTFVSNLVAHVTSIGYDGVDIDYEWPASHQEGRDFTLLMQELDAALHAADPDYLLIFGAGPGNYIGFREWSQLAGACDYCFFFGYDWRNPALGPMTNPGTSFASAAGVSFEASVRGAVDFVLGAGFPPEKLVLGLPFYSSSNRSWDASASATWSSGAPWAVDPGSLEVEIAGAWWTTPESILAKMDAVLDPQTTVLTAPGGPATLAGIGWWEWGHEDPAHPDLTGAVRQWLSSHP